MTFIRLSAPSVRKYEAEAEAQFGDIMSTLSTMVSDCAAVDYEGVNAASFKKNVVTAATTMSTDINTGMKQFIGAIASATTSVAGSLGGSPLILEPVQKQVEEVAVKDGSADEQQADTEALAALQETVTAHCTKIRGLADSHVESLNATPTGRATPRSPPRGPAARSPRRCRTPCSRRWTRSSCTSPSRPTPSSKPTIRPDRRPRQLGGAR